MITAIIIVGLTGLIIGILLVIASDKFAIDVDEKESLVREQLPGNNCGGCGYPGCDGLACAIAKGEAKVDQCPIGGSVVAKAIGEIMGVKTEQKERETAYVRCSGTCDKTKVQYYYFGIRDCQSAAVVPGAGDKKCSYGCMGYGSCMRACPYDAIDIVNGVAVVNQDKCKSCGNCIKVCPNHLIEMVPVSKIHRVKCNSSDKGPVVRKNCDAGCIACTLCTKVCPSGAITINNSLAHIDYDKCTNCGACKEKCPRKIIE